MDDTYSITIRLPAEVAAALRELAARERRSINAQIIVIIEQAVAEATEA